MSVDELITLIGSTGFPIVVTLILFKYINDTQSKTNECLSELKDAIKELALYIKSGKE